MTREFPGAYYDEWKTTNPMDAELGDEMAEYNTCVDELAQYHARIHDQLEEQRKRESVRKAVREGIAKMKENDMTFLRALISVTAEDLGGF